jgi:protein involved in polysaccharide export with SLBB domain
LRGNVADPGRFSWRPGMHLSDIIPDRDSLETRDYWWKRSHLGLPAAEFEPTVSAPQENLTPALTAKGPEDAISSRAASAGSGQTVSHGTLAAQIAQTPLPGSGGNGKLNDVRVSAPDIDWDYAVIERLDPETLKPSLIPFDLGKLVLNHDAGQDLALQPGDTVTIFSQADIIAPLDRQTKYVDLEGEFLHSGVYSVQPGETLRDVVRRAGGFTSRAYLYGSELTRESTRRLQQQRLDEYVRSLSNEVERNTQALALSGSSASSASNVNASQISGQQLIARLSQVRATGRIVLQFLPNSGSLEEVPALSLENGDRFVVPFAPAVVNVVGAVYDQNSFLYRPRRTVAQYLRLAGGPTRNADWRHAFIIRADGSVVSRTEEKRYSLWSGSSPFNALSLNPGDSIIVPDKTLRPSALRNFLDWTQMFSQLALGAAAINVL